MRVERAYAWQLSHVLPFAMRLFTIWLSSLYSKPVRWSIVIQRRLIMHPSFTGHMSKTRMEQFHREAMAMQRINQAKSNLDNTTGSKSLTHILWYVLFGLYIPSSSQKQGEAYTMQSFQARFNGTMWVIGCIALGLGLLIGSFINSNFGLLPIVLLCSIILVAVSFPIFLRSASVLSKHYQVTSHR